MGICYSEERSSGGSPVPYDKWRATESYLAHYANYLLLDFLATNSTKGDERAQARKEIEIAQKKMAFWQHHPNYDQVAVTRGIEKLKRDWGK